MLRIAGGHQQHGVGVAELVGHHLARPGVVERDLLEAGDHVEVRLAGGADAEGWIRSRHGTGGGTATRGRGRVMAGGRE